MGLTTVKTDICGFDAILGGGIPKGSSLLVSGPPGSGKTVMALQYTFNQAKKGERVLFVSTCELLYSINKFASTMSFFDLGLIKTGVNIDYYGPREEGGFIEFWDYSLGALMEGRQAGDIFDIIQEKVSAHRIDHLVIDSITSIDLFLGDGAERRRKLLAFMGWASRSGCTMVFTAEAGHDEGIARILADGLVDLWRQELPAREGLGVSVKAMEVAKLRGQAHASGRYLYSISKDGVGVMTPGIGPAPEGELAKTGVEDLDENLRGLRYGSAWHFNVGDEALYRPLVDAMAREALGSGDGLVYMPAPAEDLSLEAFRERFGLETALKGRLAILDPYGLAVPDKLKDLIVVAEKWGRGEVPKARGSLLSGGKRYRILADVGGLEKALGPAEAWRLYEYALGDARGNKNLLISYNGPAARLCLPGEIGAASDGVVDVWDYGGYALLQVKKAPYAKSFEPFCARVEEGRVRLKPL